MANATNRLAVLSKQVFPEICGDYGLSLVDVSGPVSRSFYDRDEEGILSKLHKNGCLQISLNRPSKLNAMTLPMLKLIQILVARAQFDEAVKFVLVTGEGKGFCAGGDIMTLAECHLEKEKAKMEHAPLLTRYDCNTNAYSFPRVFFATEYNLDRLIAEYTKPFVALVQGVWMGGGVGLAKNATFQICNETTLFAMPEAGIGLWPDVSATYFLPRLRGNLGLYLGLCSVRLKGIEVLTHGIASHFVPSAKFGDLKKNLISDDFQSDACVRAWIEENISKVAQRPQQKDLDAFEKTFAQVQELFKGATIHHVLDNLLKKKTDFAKQCYDTIRTKCPTSECLFFESFHRGRKLDVFSCMILEYRAAIRMVERDDFADGTLCTLKKKQGDPQYSPSRIEDVPPSLVKELLSPMPDEELEFYQIRPRA
eukprot:ANDGO_05741.mRNA.1 3-hydroxyisobutyryl-CoA hydrolase 1